MAISLSLESKSNVDLSLEEKLKNMTLDEAEGTLDEAEYTLDQPKISLVKEAKSFVSLSLEDK